MAILFSFIESRVLDKIDDDIQKPFPVGLVAIATI